MFIPRESIIWKRVNYLRQGESKDYDYSLLLNEPLASWDVWDYWERERIESMRKHLTKDDILFDIGTEQGWCNLVYAQIVGPENMVLVEPTPEFWPNIRTLWEQNYPGVTPRACFAGFFSDVTTVDDVNNYWPAESVDDLIDKNAYRYIHSHADEIPQVRIDDYVKMSKVRPAALTIDVEGAELLVLQGAQLYLKYNDVKVWVSEHDDMAERDYDVKPGEVETFMARLGYEREVLALDHERHVYYFKP